MDIMAMLTKLLTKKWTDFCFRYYRYYKLYCI